MRWYVAFGFSNVSEGYTNLWELKRLDLTVETYVLKPEYQPLFSEDELDVARSRLRDYGYEPATG